MSKKEVKILEVEPEAVFDAVACEIEVTLWYENGGREELEKAMEVLGRDRAMLARSFEVRPRTLSEAVTF